MLQQLQYGYILNNKIKTRAKISQHVFIREKERKDRESYFLLCCRPLGRRYKVQEMLRVRIQFL